MEGCIVSIVDWAIREGQLDTYLSQDLATREQARTGQAEDSASAEPLRRTKPGVRGMDGESRRVMRVLSNREVTGPVEEPEGEGHAGLHSVVLSSRRDFMKS